MESSTIRNSMYRHIRGYNKVLTLEHLKTLTDVELLDNCSPLYREGYARLLYKNGDLDRKTAEKYGKMTMRDE